MTTEHPPVTSAAPSLYRGGVVEQMVFGIRHGSAIEAAVTRFCQETLGAGVAETMFRATSVGVVFGVELEDGRRVLVKAHQPRESRKTLEAVHRVQAQLHREGFPCPAPLVSPTPLGNALATAEALVDEGEVRDTHDPVLRRVMAEALAWHLELTRSCGKPNALAGGWDLYASDGLWPREPHAPIFDFEATAAGAEWIDAIASKAKQLAAAPALLLIGHTDWSGKHFRFADVRVTAVYDWDSLRIRPEPQIVGNAAMTFTTNFDLPGLKLAPSPDEVRAFIDEYSAARATSLTRHERQQIAACATFIAAYIARCEHCRHDGHDADTDPNSFISALREHSEEYLRV